VTRPTIAICICTRNRPRELRRALASVPRSAIPVDQIVVADDSTEESTAKLVGSHSAAELVQGPRRGLGANRNAAIGSLRTSHVLFLDDDAELDPAFLTNALNCLGTGAADGAIVTGRETKEAVAVAPHDLTFLGFQRRPYAPGETLRTLVINSTLFPTTLFDRIRFDPQLVYGYEETDIAARAVANGYRIRFCPNAVNHHHPSQAGRDRNEMYVDASRLYSTWKRYDRVEGRRLKSLLYLIVGSAHHLGASARRHGVQGVPGAARSIVLACGFIRNLLRNPTLDRC